MVMRLRPTEQETDEDGGDGAGRAQGPSTSIWEFHHGARDETSRQVRVPLMTDGLPEQRCRGANAGFTDLKHSVTQRRDEVGAA
jgi:hypothetical protein